MRRVQMLTEAIPCEVEGCGRLTRSQLRVCRSNPVCDAERVRRGRIVTKLGGVIPAEFPSLPEPVLCRECGENYTTSEYGVCQVNPICKLAHQRMYLADAEKKEANRAYQRQRRTVKGDRIRARQRRRYARNSDVITARARQRRAEVGDAIRARDRARIKRPGRPCRYAKQGCRKFAIPNSRLCDFHHRTESRRRQQRKRDRAKEKMAVAQNYVCGWCGRKLPGNLKGCAEDHIIPKAIGIVIEDAWNKQLLHSVCNLQKGTKITARALELARQHGVNLGRYYVLASSPRELLGDVPVSVPECVTEISVPPEPEAEAGL
jgi:hypothetical protein